MIGSALVITASLVGVASGFVPGRTTRGFLPSTESRAAPSQFRTAAQYPIIVDRGASPSSLGLRSSSSSSSSSSPSDPAAETVPSDWESQILSALSVAIDPDLESDVVSLGFVRSVRIDDSSVVSIDLELPTPWRPVEDPLAKQCQDVVNNFEWTRGADVSVAFRQSAPAPGSPLGMARVGAVIAVSSCKGGVGKSTTAVNLAFALRATGAEVGIFDADVYGPSLPTMVTPEDDDVRFVGRQIAPLRRGGVGLMSFGYVNEGSAAMRGPMVTQLLDQFLSLTDWGAIDYLVLDMPPGTGDIQLTLTQKLNIDAAVIVTTPQELSFVDVERGVEMFDTVEVPCVAVVENMAYFEQEKAELDLEIDETLLEEKFLEALQKDGALLQDAAAATEVAGDLVKIVQENLRANKQSIGENEEIRIFGQGHKRRLSEQWGIEHTYSVPLLGKIAQNGDSGTPFILDNPDSSQAEIYRQLAKSVVSEVAKVKLGKSKGGGRPNVMYNSESHIIQVIEEGGEGDDQNVSTISTAGLRRACRCAECVEELTGKQLLNPSDIPESVKPLSMSPTGNYALSVDWSDGHRSLYPYRQIRSLLDANKDVAEGLETTKEKAAL